MTKVAIAQESPVFLNKVKTIKKAVTLIKQASSSGAKLIVFPEAFIPGYPAWLWRLRPGSDWSVNEKLYASLFDNSVDLNTDDILPICRAAKKHNINVVCGLNEKDNKLSQATLYNTVITIASDGTIINRHRKLMPTNPERMIWGFGDGSGLKVVDTPIGRIGALMCWENYMPLARYALYSQGIEIYIAPTYDSGDGWVGTIQHIAREGRCWVICCGVALENSDIPSDFPDRKSLYPESEDWINPGDSLVVKPGGEIVAGPMHNDKGMLYCDIDAKLVGTAKRTLDVAGHYSRPDIFKLHVNTKSQSSVEFE